MGASVEARATRAFGASTGREAYRTGDYRTWERSLLVAASGARTGWVLIVWIRGARGLRNGVLLQLFQGDGDGAFQLRVVAFVHRLWGPFPLRYPA